MLTYVVLYIISFNIFHDNFVYSHHNNENIGETVLISSSSNIKYIELPTSDQPILIWMEVWKGSFPNVTKDLTSASNVTVGEPITLFIFFKNSNNPYDIRVTDCWAYDNENFLLSNQKLHLNGLSSKRMSNKVLSKWKKIQSNMSPSFLYASFISFKFPEKDRIFLTCDIQLTGREQH